MITLREPSETEHLAIHRLMVGPHAQTRWVAAVHLARMHDIAAQQIKAGLSIRLALVVEIRTAENAWKAVQ